MPFFTHSAWKMVISTGAMRSASFRPIVSAVAKTSALTRSADGPLPRMKIVSVLYVDAISAMRREKSSIKRLPID